MPRIRHWKDLKFYRPKKETVYKHRVVRTIFLLRYISDIPLRKQITKTTNVAERYNQFCEWIRFASGGLMAENDPEEMQKRVRYTDIVANALILQNVGDLTAALEQLRQQGYPVQSEDVAHLSAYMTEHLQRFGEYTLKLRPVAPLSDQEKTFTDSRSEQSEDSEEMSA
jgi:Tn3 transposase DDE domain-containing protein